MILGVAKEKRKFPPLSMHTTLMTQKIMAGDDNTVSTYCIVPTPFLQFTVWLSPCRLWSGAAYLPSYLRTYHSLVVYFFSRNLMAEKMRRRPPLLSSSCALSLPYITQRYGRLSIGCCILSSSRSHRNLRPHRPLYFYFFRTPFVA
jgi:hypothetical protein